MDDNLAIALVFNTDKQMYINFEKIFFLFSENQKNTGKSGENREFIVQRGCMQGSGFRSNHRKCFKKSRKMAKILGKYISKEGMALTIVMVFYGFV